MKEKIDDQEDVAAAAAELEKAEVEVSFEKLEAESELDAELAALKAKVKGGPGEK